MNERRINELEKLNEDSWNELLVFASYRAEEIVRLRVQRLRDKETIAKLRDALEVLADFSSNLFSPPSWGDILEVEAIAKSALDETEPK